jgi:uroporphyrinogen decarboxylase
MALSERENFLRAVTFDGPEWIPSAYMSFYHATWRRHGEALERLVLRHPLIYHDYARGSVDFHESPPGARGGEYFTDNWGCVWYVAPEGGGMMGQVVEHPLADWSALATYVPPDPLALADRRARDWQKFQREVADRKRRGKVAWGQVGSVFDILYHLRGFENLMVDFATDAPQLPVLIDMVTGQRMVIVDKLLEIGVDAIYFHADIGFQHGLMIRPAQFRKYVKPMWKKLFTRCREAGTHVYLSSEGRLLDIVDDMIECGVSIQDVEMASQSLDEIADAYKGRLCVMFYPDAQRTPRWRPQELRAHIEQVVTRLGSPSGGLVFAGYPTPDVPLENIEEMARAMEDYRTYWWEGRGNVGSRRAGPGEPPDNGGLRIRAPLESGSPTEVPKEVGSIDERTP